MKKKIKVNQKNTFYFFLLAYVLALVVLAIIFRPFIYALILGIVLGVFFFPVNIWLQRRGIKPSRSALLMVFLILILILSSSFFFINSVVKEATATYTALATYDFEDVDNFIQTYLGFNVSTEKFVLPLMNTLQESLTVSIPDIISSIVELFVGLFVMLFLLYYIFKDGDNLMRSIMGVLPVSEKHKTEIKDESRKILYGVMYGQLLIAILQGFLGGLAFMIFGLSNPVFWGFIMAILAFIPILGTPAVWVPAGIIQIISGNLFAGIGLLAFGAFIMFTIENIVRPKIIGRRSGMHPLLVVLSIFGGIKLFGVIGLIIGPVLVALCVLIIKIFNEELVLFKKEFD